MNKSLSQYYCCPEQQVPLMPSGPLSGESGYFEFEHNVLYGQLHGAGTASTPEHALRNVSPDCGERADAVYLPFDVTHLHVGRPRRAARQPPLPGPGARPLVHRFAVRGHRVRAGRGAAARGGPGAVEPGSGGGARLSYTLILKLAGDRPSRSSWPASSRPRWRLTRCGRRCSSARST